MELTAFQADPAAIVDGVNYVWVLTVTFLIFFMHAGFAMLEAGQVRSKNVANQLTKNMLTWSVGVTIFFLVGAATSRLTANLTGGQSYELLAVFDPANASVAAGGGWVSWLFGAVFAMTAATIVSGAVAGRMKLRAYVTYTIVLAGIIYPVVTGMTWAGGLLATQFQFADFAGGMIVHGMGGIAGLTAAWVVGPRLGRYDEDGTVNVIPGHSMTFAVLGTLILCFGWYGFNVGTAASPLGASDGGVTLAAWENVGRVALTTTLGMAAGAMGAAAIALARTGKVDTLYVANGMLAGLVGITSNTNLITWYGALLIGGLAGAQLPIVFEFVEKRLKIDDVCAVFPVHGSAGVLGALLVAVPFLTVPGAGVSAVSQIVGVAIIAGWTILATGAVFGALKAIGEIRVSPAHEREGLDISEHGVETYPEFSGEESGVPEGTGVAPDGGVVADDDEIVTDGGLPNEGGLKLVMAVIRPEKLGAVKQAVAEVGAPHITVTNVSGRGTQPSKTGQWRGEEYVVDLHQKVKVECVVADVPAGDVAEAIAEAASTGEPGDGKVFITPVEDAVQIRTGERGRDAV